jgi:hypothetical protein
MTLDLGSIETLRLGIAGNTKRKSPSGFTGLVSLRAARGERSGPREPHHTDEAVNRASKPSEHPTRENPLAALAIAGVSNAKASYNLSWAAAEITDLSSTEAAFDWDPDIVVP